MAIERKRKPNAVTLSEVNVRQGKGLSFNVQHAFATAFVGILFIIAFAGLFRSCVSSEAALAFAVAGSLSIVAFEALNLLGISRFSLRIIGSFLTALGAVATWFVPALRMGLFSLANQIISRFDDAFGAYAPLFPLAENAVAPWPFFACLGFVCAFIAWLLLTGRLIVAITLFTFVLCGGAGWLQTGWLPAGIIALLAWLISWRLILNNRYISLRSLGLATLTAMALVGVSAGICSFYTPSAAIHNIRNAIVEGVEEARYGSDTLAQGNIFEAASMNEGNQTRLQVTYAGVHDMDIHLNGFVGGVYENETWKALDHTAYEGTWSGVYAWLNDQGMNPHTQRALFDDENTARTGGQTTATALTIDALGADRHYIYTPVELRSVSGATFDASLDGSLNGDGLVGPSTYTLRIDDVNTSADIATTPDWVAKSAAEAGMQDESSFSATESIYRSFVYEHYLDITEEQQSTIERLFYDPLTWTNQQPSSAAVMSRVRIMLSTLASYSDNPERYPGTGDFSSWFLEDTHQGNSAYFATAAVLALRDQGIPARYVEGYYISADTEYPQNESGREVMTLTAADAHAWVEVYLDGMGWSPLEVTPGFYTQPYKADNLIEVNQDYSDGQSDKTEPTGALGGSTDKTRVDMDENKNDTGVTPVKVALSIGILLLVALMALAVIEWQRSRKIARLRSDCASDDQHVAVPALFEQLMLLCGAAGISFSEAHPLDCAEEVADTFVEITREEYNRAIGLMQKFAFGAAMLKPNEMRVLRSLNRRIADMLQVPKDVKAKLAWRYTYLR